MSDELVIFGDPNVAIVWLVGARACTGTPDPTCLRSLTYELSPDGWSMELRVDTAHQPYSCIAMLPVQMTAADAEHFWWFGSAANQDDRLRHMPTAGRA
jgi:hypothetical protein